MSATKEQLELFLFYLSERFSLTIIALVFSTQVFLLLKTTSLSLFSKPSKIFILN